MRKANLLREKICRLVVDFKTGDTTITELSPGLYQAVIDVSGDPIRYFIQILP